MIRKIFRRGMCLLLAALCLAGCTPLSQEQPQEPSVPEPVVTPSETQKNYTVTIFEFSQLQQLTAGDYLHAGDEVRIVRDMEISSQIVFDEPLNLRIEANVTFPYPVIFDTREEGTIDISSTCPADVRIDAPNCHVTWASGCPYGTEQAAARALNVRTFNGVDLLEKYGLGGLGTQRLTTLKLEKKNNSSLSGDLEFTVQGNTAYLSVSYLVSDKVLKNATVTLGTDDGSENLQKLDLTVKEQTITLTDPQGGQRTYLIVAERITYNLPVFYIEIEGGKEVKSREKYLSATLTVDTSTAAGEFPGLNTSQILIRGRGHFSWKFNKKPYKIRFEKKTSVLGLNASKNWVLIANYTDRSLMQNYLAMEMGKVMTNIPYHSNQYPVDVFVNGSYRGVYTFGEQLEAKEERIDLEESFTEPDTDYLLEVGGYDEGDVYGRDYFHAGTLRYIAIKHPDSTQLTKEQLDFLTDYVRDADEAVRMLDGYEDYIDVDSLIDWVIIHELTYNLDCCFRRSCYLIKEKGGKLKMGPIWDFDLAFGSFYRYTSGDWATIGSNGGYVGVTWMNYLKKDPAFMAKMKARWKQIRQPLLDTALNSLDEMHVLIKPSAEMNFKVWNILGKSVSSQPSSHKKYNTYDKMVQRLRDFIVNRYNWLDKQLR